MTSDATPGNVRPNDGLGVCRPERDDAAEHALLERAAAAAGLVVESWIAWGGAWVYPAGAPMNADGEPPIQKWSPLEDDADALRLLLALKMQIGYVCDQPCVDGVLAAGMTAEESFRRAVVRAAAARSKAPNVALTGRAK